MNDEEVKQSIISKFQLEPYDFDDVGEIMILDDFIDEVVDGNIIDYDGWGEVLYKNQLISNAELCVDAAMIRLDSKNSLMNIGMEKIWELFGNDIKIAWYNK